jgi:broad specificity phosphatase PhoE
LARRSIDCDEERSWNDLISDTSVHSKIPRVRRATSHHGSGTRHRERQAMSIEIVYETHSTTEDSENGVATGWLPGHLSEAGIVSASILGQRRRDDGLAAIFVSDLARAVETARVAFVNTTIPVFTDWRLRECDYGQLNGAAVSEVHRDRRKHLDVPYPGGESWRQATDRVGCVLSDLPLRWEGKWSSSLATRPLGHSLGA